MAVIRSTRMVVLKGMEGHDDSGRGPLFLEDSEE